MIEMIETELKKEPGASDQADLRDAIVAAGIVLHVDRTDEDNKEYIKAKTIDLASKEYVAT